MVNKWHKILISGTQIAQILTQCKKPNKYQRFLLILLLLIGLRSSFDAGTVLVITYIIHHVSSRTHSHATAQGQRLCCGQFFQLTIFWNKMYCVRAGPGASLQEMCQNLPRPRQRVIFLTYPGVKQNLSKINSKLF